MNVLLSLSLWLSLMMSSCCGDAAGREEETTTSDYYDDYPSATPTPDYDYNSTFDYYYVTGLYPAEVHGQASGVGRVSPLLLLGLAVHQIWN
ncbi:hypothetical protein VZT92_025336 [Zoarces viviparus]|uniref:Uncharacterized protein n=1 Tax=Zoarces viviparus TaxID=48416 RepID=A0AAW1E053_ZOAVI